MKAVILTLGLVWVVGTGPLYAQETARERARETLPSEVFQEVEALATEARRDGIPEELLFNKALEGAAKHVPSDRLVPAVLAYASRLGEARGAFGESGTEPLLVAGADALQRGVQVETLRRLGQEAAQEGGGGREGARPSPMAVLVLADLVESGVPADRALGVLREAMRMRVRDQDMLGISARVRQLLRQGQSPQEAADQVRRALQQGRGPGGMGPPVPPGSEPLTRERRQSGNGGGGGGG